MHRLPVRASRSEESGPLTRPRQGRYPGLGGGK